MKLEQIALLRRHREFGMTNGGWRYDAYPDLEALDAGKAITIGLIEGPAVITNIHSTQHLLLASGRQPTDENAMIARGVILEIYFDDVPIPAVCIPFADFFADGCGGVAEEFSSLFVEKAPGAYNCFIPMPFKESARIVLRNETPFDLMNYSFVEFERLEQWDENYGYFHATWHRRAFQLHAHTDELFFHVDACGHVVGRAWSVCTDDPFFNGFHFVMEGNNEVRIDNAARPTANYLGTEDSFAFSWGFRKTHSGLYNGMNYVQADTPSMLSIYRFRETNAIRFNQSIDWRVNWSYEWKNNSEFQSRIEDMRQANRGWVDYATTFYWYQDRVGFEHPAMPSLEDRSCKILHPNDIESE
jgi:hypothetical protein